MANAATTTEALHLYKQAAHCTKSAPAKKAPIVSPALTAPALNNVEEPRYTISDSDPPVGNIPNFETVNSNLESAGQVHLLVLSLVFTIVFYQRGYLLLYPPPQH